MSPNNPAVPTKATMVRRANLLQVALAAATVVYLLIAVLLELSGEGFSARSSFVLQLFFVLALLSLATIGMTVFVMTSKRLLSGTSRYGPLWRAFQIMSIGAILSEAQAIYGLILTFLSGTIFYSVGFTLVAWASLLWVRARFKQNLAKLPDTSGTC